MANILFKYKINETGFISYLPQVFILELQTTMTMRKIDVIEFYLATRVQTWQRPRCIFMSRLGDT